MLDADDIQVFCYRGYINHIKLVIKLFNDNQINVNEFFTLISPICVDPERRGQFREYIEQTLNYNGDISIIS